MYPNLESHIVGLEAAVDSILASLGEAAFQQQSDIETLELQLESYQQELALLKDILES